MKYSTFEQAAAEASYGAQEIDTQLEQMKAQMTQLQSKRDMLQLLTSQLLSVRPDGTGMAEFARPSNVAEIPKPEQAQPVAAESQTSDAGGARSLRQEWISLGSDAGAAASADSTIRGRL